MEILNELEKKRAREKMVRICETLGSTDDLVDNYIFNQISKAFEMAPEKIGVGPEAEYNCPLCHHPLYQYYNWKCDQYCEMCGQKIKGPKRVHGLRVKAYESI